MLTNPRDRPIIGKDSRSFHPPLATPSEKDDFGYCRKKIGKVERETKGAHLQGVCLGVHRNRFGLQLQWQKTVEKSTIGLYYS